MKRTEKFVVVSPKEAERLLKFNNFAGQRTIRLTHVKQLAEKMKDGRFHVGNIALLHDETQTLLADGQHQLTACVEAGVPFKAVMQEYSVNGDAGDPRAMAKVFSQFNVDAVRSRGNIAWIWGCELGWNDWPKELVKTLAAALSIVHMGDFRPLTMSKDESASLLADNIKVCEWVHSMEITPARHIRRAPVMAAMITTYRKAPRAAEEFWVAVRDGANLSKRDPRLTIREFLKETVLHGGDKACREGRDTADRRSMYAKCIHAWNAWRTDKPTSLKYHAQAALPKPA